MAAPDPNNVLRLGGRFSLNPSNFSAAWPFGGVGLGLSLSAAFALNSESSLIDRPGRDEPQEFLYRGETPQVSAVFSEWSDDLIPAVFPNTKTGASGAKILSGGQLRSGSRLSDKAAVLLFSPFDPVGFGFLALHRAIPLMDVSGEVALSFSADALYRVVWTGLANATGKVYTFGTKADVQSELGL